jgi:hypothetical protein
MLFSELLQVGGCLRVLRWFHEIDRQDIGKSGIKHHKTNPFGPFSFDNCVVCPSDSLFGIFLYQKDRQHYCHRKIPKRLSEGQTTQLPQKDTKGVIRRTDNTIATERYQRGYQKDRQHLAPLSS